MGSEPTDNEAYTPPCRNGAERDVIDLLLVEYSTLRDEVIARTSIRGQTATVMVAIGALFVALYKAPIGTIAIVVGVLLLMGVGNWARMGAMVSALDARLAVLEGRINDLAAIAYDTNSPLLTWEQDVCKSTRGSPFFLKSSRALAAKNRYGLRS
jgi:hypothetical protein